MKTTIEKLKAIPRPDQAKISINKHFGLIVPPSPFVVPCGWEWTHTAPFEGPSIVATLVKGLGYKFTLLDQRENFDPNSLVGKTSQYDIISIATYEDNFPFIRRAIEIAKEEKNSRPVILGGPLVTSAPELLLKNSKADFAILGEGELTTIELLEYLEKKSNTLPIEKIDGLAWKNENGDIIINNPRKQMTDLDIVPFQDFSVWERFKNKEIPEIYLSTSRGCKHACTFCYRAMPKWALKSVDRVKNEIEYLKKYKFKHAWINDLSFTSDIPRVHQLMDQAFSTHNFSWNCFARVNEIDLPVLENMKSHGCDIILYGFEAVSAKVLESYHKGIEKNDMMRAIEITREAKIKVGGLFIVGAPDETEESLQNICDFAKQFKEVTRVKYLSALPGTPLYQNAIKQGIIKDPVKHLEFLAREESIEEDIEKEGFLFFPKAVTKERVREIYRQVNGTIAKRPYDYTNNQNNFLDKELKFTRRGETK